MKKSITIAAYALIAWAFFVTGAYFLNHWTFIDPIGDRDIVDGAKYFGFILILGAWIILTIKKSPPKQIKKGISLKILLPALLILTILLSWSRFIWEDMAIYHGDIFLKGEEQLEAYGAEAFNYSDIELIEGKLVVNPAVKYASDWEWVQYYFERISPLDALINTTFHITFYFIFTLLLLAIFNIYGRITLQQIFPKKDPGNSLLFSIGTGIAIVTLLLLGLSLIGLLTPYGMLGILVILPIIIVCLNFSYFKKDTTELLNWKTPAAKDLKIISLISVLIIVICTIWNFIQTSAPWPSGFDDLLKYMNLPNLMAQYGGFVGIDSANAFAFIQSIGTVLFENTAFAQIITGIFGTLSALAMFSLTKRHTSEPVAWLVAAVTILMPTVFYHSHVDLKVEMPMLFFSIISVLAFDIWTERKDNKLLFLCGLFAGFALSIKLSAIILLPTLFVLIFIKSIKNWRAWTAFIIGIFLVMLPWFTINIISNGNLDSPMNLLMDSENQLGTTQIPYTDLGLDTSLCTPPAGPNEHYIRYKMEINGLLDIIKSPWNMTIINSTLSPAVDLGPLFLAFCPIILLLLFTKKKNTALLLIIGTLLYWTTWLAISNHVLWYGVTGFVFLLLILGISTDYLTKKSKLLQILTLVLIFTVLFAGFWSRSNWFLARSYPVTAYISGLIDSDGFLDNVYPEHSKLAEILNSDPNDKIYITNSVSALFFTNYNNNRVFADTYLEFFDCMYQNYEADETKIQETIQSLGFKYMVLAAPIYDETYDINLAYASENILNFAMNNLTYLGGNADTYVFAMPTIVQQ
ncbi:MAG: glycosyltransferase family 39 protein [Patescibacteria group bacterium]